MSTCIYCSEGSIKIKKENMDNVLEKLSNYFKEGGRLQWVDGFKSVDEDYSEDELNDIWYDLGYGLKFNGDNYEIVDFLREKEGDEDKLFELIASYCEDGYLEFNSDCDYQFRLIIKDGKFERKYPTISWE